jgi:hypothetical protein
MARFEDPNMTAAIAARWRLALADAELRDGDDVILHVFDGMNEPGEPGAMAVEPGSSAWEVAAYEFPFVAQQADRSRANCEVYEVLAYAGFSDRSQLAVLRHELEHVRQRRLALYLLRASTAIQRGLIAAPLPTLVARSLYIALPTERAADAAGRHLAIEALGPPTADEAGKGHDVLLFGPDDGPSEEEIRWRMLANMMILPASTADAAIACFKVNATREAVLGDLADGLCPDEGRELAERLLRDQRFQTARQRLLDAMKQVGAADPPGSVRDTLRRLVLNAEAAAADAIGVYAVG